jgi:integrase
MTVRFSLRKDGYIILMCRHLNDRPEYKIADCIPKYWDAGNRMVKEKHPDFEFLYPLMMSILVRAKVELRKNPTDATALLAKLTGTTNENYDLIVWLQEYMDKLVVKSKTAAARNDIIERNRLLGNKARYNDAFRKLKKFYSVLYYKDLDKKEVRKMIDYFMGDDATSDQTAVDYLGRIKTVYGYMIEDYDLADLKPFKQRFPVVSTRSYDAIKKRVSNEALMAMRDFKGLPSSQQRAVDLFFATLHLGGCDLTDLYFALKENYIDGRMYMQRAKVRGSAMDLLATPQVKKFIDTYGAKEGVYLLPFPKEVGAYKTFRDNTRRDLQAALKKMSVLTVAGHKVTMKCVRHTFASRAKEIGVDGDLLREIMGHRRNDIDNFYKEAYPAHIRDAAQLKVIDLNNAAFAKAK